MKRLLYVVLLIAGATLVPIAPANAAACSGTSGVTVVVQFPDHIEVGCALTDQPISGRQALQGAGFHVTVVSKFPGAVCQIEYFPDTSCANMPPASAYWEYFHANPGGSWDPSDYGYENTKPKPGSFEGWRFGDGNSDPDYAIPPAPTPTAKPTSHPTTQHPSAPGSTTPTASSHVAGPGSTPTAPAAGSTAHASASTPTASAAATPTGTDATEAQPTEDVGRAAAAYKKESSGSNQSWIWGVVLVAVLGTAGAATAARRRRS